MLDGTEPSKYSSYIVCLLDRLVVSKHGADVYHGQAEDVNVIDLLEGFVEVVGSDPSVAVPTSTTGVL